MVRTETVSRYDITLLLVPLCFLGTGVAAVAFDLNVHLALGVAATASSLPIVDSLFFNPPTRYGSRDRNGLTDSGPSR